MGAVRCRSVRFSAVQGTLLLPTRSPHHGPATGLMPPGCRTVLHVVRQTPWPLAQAVLVTPTPAQQPLGSTAPDPLPRPQLSTRQAQTCRALSAADQCGSACRLCEAVSYHQADGCRSGRCPHWARPCCWVHDCPGHRRWWRPECGLGCRWEIRGALLRRTHVRHCAAGVAGQLLRAVRTARPWVIVWPRGWLDIGTGHEPVLPVRRVRHLTNARQPRLFAARATRSTP